VEVVEVVAIPAVVAVPLEQGVPVAVVLPDNQLQLPEPQILVGVVAVQVLEAEWLALVPQVAPA
jgi:hypothetical protein